MIRPVRYSGRSGSNSHASANMSAGPSTQFSTRDRAISRLLAVTRWVSSYRTFASTGYIITSRPRAIGRETDPIFTASSAWARPGTNRPSSLVTREQRGRWAHYTAVAGVLDVARDFLGEATAGPRCC